jgi:uncharacterized protein YktB (UPF0637 family)
VALPSRTGAGLRLSAVGIRCRWYAERTNSTTGGVFVATKTALAGFTAADFDVFTIEGFEPRMTALKAQVRPKLEALGTVMAPKLTDLVGQTIYPHVAKHMRRTVNPPDDTWVAFSTNPRGYKASPHFQVGLWSTYLFIRFATIYESPNKSVIARNLMKHPRLAKDLPAEFTWSWDHCKPDTASYAEMKAAGLKKGLERAIKVQKAEVLCGLDLQRGDERLADGDRLIATIEETFAQLLPLYRLSFE